MKRFLSALEQMTPANAGEYSEAWGNFLAEGKPVPLIAAFYNMRSAEWCRHRPPGIDRNAALSAVVRRATTVDQALAAEFEQFVQGQ